MYKINDDGCHGCHVSLKRKKVYLQMIRLVVKFTFVVII